MENGYIDLIIVVVISILIAFFFIKMMFSNMFQLFKSIIVRMSLLSLVFVTSFAFIYICILILDLKTAKISNHAITEDILSIKGLELELYKENPFLAIADLFYYSATTFFHLDGNNIYITGFGKIIHVIEGFLGIILPIFFILTFVLDYKQKEKDADKILKIYLNRNWNILSVSERDYDLKEYVHIELIGPNNELELIFVKLTRDVEELIRKFSFKWDFTDLSQLPYFAKFLEKELNKNGKYELGNEALILYINGAKSLTDEYYRKYKLFLDKLINENTVLVSYESYKLLQMAKESIDKKIEISKLDELKLNLVDGVNEDV